MFIYFFMKFDSLEYLFQVMKNINCIIVNDDSLMTNHERGKKRPTYFTIKEKDILWFIPLSSKVDKYQKIVDSKIRRYSFCNSIIIDKVFDRKHAILLQNAFPTLEKYIDHVHMVDGKPALVSTLLQQKILRNFKSMLKMKERGVNLFFTNIDKIKEIIDSDIPVNV